MRLPQALADPAGGAVQLETCVQLDHVCSWRARICAVGDQEYVCSRPAEACVLLTEACMCAVGDACAAGELEHMCNW